MPSEQEAELTRQYRHWRPALMSFFMKRVHDRTEAEDLTQEVFARLFGGAGAKAAGYPGYVFQVAANLLRDRARRAKVRSDYRDAVDALYGQEIDWVDPEMVATGRDMLSRLAVGLEQLPERTRHIFILYRVENIEKRMIAESFGISTSAVEKHVARALAHLIAWTQGEPQ